MARRSRQATAVAEAADPAETAVVREVPGVKPPKLKRLVLCLDGTWNTDDGQEITNIVRLRDLVDPRYDSPDGLETWHQQVYYHTGVGTGFSAEDKVVGGGTGAGLDKNVRDAYRFLSQHYAPGVEIFLFGFSRGAFTARSLAGYIGASGLLRPELCTPTNERRAWAFYRTPPNSRYPHESGKLSELCFPDVRIRCIGVFDTVGALGIPSDLFQGFNRRRFSFHDVTLGSNIDYAFHAVGIDEKRGPFAATLWQYPNHRSFEWVEQVWFPGVHSNVGGGYPSEGLSSVALEWMLLRIQAKGLDLRLLPDWETSIKPDSCAVMYDSRTPLYAYSRFAPRVRVINQYPLQLAGPARLSTLPRHAAPLGEMIHWTALQRWKKSATEHERVPEPYRPVNLEAALNATFGLASRSGRPVPIVGDSGEPLQWLTNLADREALMQILPSQFEDGMKQIVSQFEGSEGSFDPRPYEEPFQQPRPRGGPRKP